jgi:hypothetical protein
MRHLGHFPGSYLVVTMLRRLCLGQERRRVMIVRQRVPNSLTVKAIASITTTYFR